MITRRRFLGSVATGSAAAMVPSPPAALGELLATDRRPPQQVAGDEAFWREVQLSWSVDRSITNLNNGGVSPSPRSVHDKYKERLDVSNNVPPYHMWEVLGPNREAVRQQLARAVGCDPEEVAITRNTTESLMTCQHGLDLERGDEVLTTDQDYPRMLQAFEQRVRRQGVVLQKLELPVPCRSDDDVVERFAQAITPRTRAILVCHVINLTGQVLPVRRIAALGRSKGIPVIVDGAHAIAHFPFRLDELGCDYYGSSLHKWLFAPIGTGLLYVRRERIADLWPLFAAREELQGDIRKFEEIGTVPVAVGLGIAEALRFHELLGAERKAARLVYLRDRWIEALADLDRVQLNTDLALDRAFGIANVRVAGVATPALSRHLWDRHRILVAPIVHPRFEGLRVSPGVYTTLEELDRFVDAMRSVVQHGLPG